MALNTKMGYAAGLLALVTICLSFGYMYADDTALMDENGDPRICEFSYDEDTSAERQEKIPVCLALQVTDIFSQVFFVAALSVCVTSLFRTALAGDEEEVPSGMPTFIGLTAVASILTVFGRAEFGHILEMDGEYHQQLTDLKFQKTPFGVVFWTNFTFLVILFSVLVISMAMNMRMAGMMTHMSKKSKESEETRNDSFFGF